MAHSPDFAQILERARANKTYLAHPNFRSNTVWVPSPCGRFEVLARRDSDNEDTPAGEEPEAATITALAVVHPDFSYLATDASLTGAPAPWQVDMGPNEVLATSRCSMVLAPVPKSVSPLLHAEWPAYQAQIEQTTKDVLPAVAKSGLLMFNNDRLMFKLTQKWFEPRDPLPDPEPVEAEDVDGNGDQTGAVNHSRINVYALDMDVQPEYRGVNLPFRPEHRDTLLSVLETYAFSPLCAYRYSNTDTDADTVLPNPALRPSEYTTVLPGSVVQVSFTLTHRLMKRPHNTSSHFAGTINKIQVIRGPQQISLSPSKALRKKWFGSGGPAAGTGKGTKRGANAEAGPSGKRTRSNA